MKKHNLYKNGDTDAPEQIKDRNGEVVLSLCRDCGKAESELGFECTPRVFAAPTGKAGKRLSEEIELKKLSKHLSSKLGVDNRVVLNAIAGYMGFRNFQAVAAKLKHPPAENGVLPVEADEAAYHRYCDVVNAQGWDEASQIIHLEGCIGQEKGMLSKLADYAERVAKEEASDFNEVVTSALTDLAMDDGSFDVWKARSTKIIPMRSMLHVVIANSGKGEEFDWFLTKKEADEALVEKSHETSNVRQIMIRTPQWDMPFHEVSLFIWDEFIDFEPQTATSAGYTIGQLNVLWKRLSDVPTVFEGENVDKIEESFLHFPAGTHREVIWHWFEKMNPQFSVGEMMSGGDSSEKNECVGCGLPTSTDAEGLCNSCSQIAEKIEYDSVFGAYKYLKNDDEVIMLGAETMAEAVAEVVQNHL